MNTTDIATSVENPLLLIIFSGKESMSTMKTDKRLKSSIDSGEQPLEPIRKSARERKTNVSNIYEYEIQKKSCHSPSKHQETVTQPAPSSLKFNKRKIESVKCRNSRRQLNKDTESCKQMKGPLNKTNSISLNKVVSDSDKILTPPCKASSSRTKKKRHLSNSPGLNLCDVSSGQEAAFIQDARNNTTEVSPDFQKPEMKLVKKAPKDTWKDNSNTSENKIDAGNKSLSCCEMVMDEGVAHCELTTSKKNVSKQLLVKKLELSPIGANESCSQDGSFKSKATGKDRMTDSEFEPQLSRRRSTKKRKPKPNNDNISTELDLDEELESSGDDYEPEPERQRRSTRKLCGNSQRTGNATNTKPEIKDEICLKIGNKGDVTLQRECYCSYCGKMFKNHKLVTAHERVHSGEKPYSCSICCQKFVLKANMKHHELLHSEDRPFMCEICGKCFKTKSYCSAHRQIHQTTKHFKCDIPGCGKAFSNRRNYHVHLLVHQGKRPYTCEFCGKAFRRKSDLNIHSSVHSEKKFECQVCGKKFSQKFAFNAHMLLHRRKPFNCGQCRRFFATEAEKNTHEELHARHRFYDCEICDRDNIGLQELCRHLKKVHNFESLNLKCSKCCHTFPMQSIFDQHTEPSKHLKATCTFCNKILSSACELYFHRRKHRRDKMRNNEGKGENICNICGKEFLRKSSLLNHKQVHESGKYKCSTCGKESKNRNSFRAHAKTHSGVKPFCCETCGKSFVSKNNLEQHFLIHTGEKPHICDICNKAFRTRPLLREHGNVHRSENPYKCELCGKEYASRTNFKNHLNVHKGERNYQCDICGKKFFAKYVMRKHVQIHTGQKNYQCEYCGKKFIQHGNWLIHRRSHTGEKPHSCPQCPAGFVNSSQLKSHIRRVHDQKKEFMCDKCYKHFYDRKGLQAHMQNIHVKKEHGRIYHCNKCDKAFALEENLQNHEGNCSETGKAFPCLRPTVLQSVLRQVYSQPQIQVVHKNNSEESISKKSQVTQKILVTKCVDDKDINVLSEKCASLVPEPVQVIVEDSQSNPAPCPVQQFQIISVPEDDSDSDSQTFSLKTSQWSSPSDYTETLKAVKIVMETVSPSQVVEVKLEADTEQEFCSSGFETDSSKPRTEKTRPSSSGIKIGANDSYQSIPHKVILSTVQNLPSKKLHQKPRATSTNISEPKKRQKSIEEAQQCFVKIDRADISSEPMFQCRLCKKVFMSESEAMQHKRVHQKQLLYQCSICRLRFGSASSLTKHLQIHFQLPKQSSQSNLNQTSNILPKLYSCDICSKDLSMVGLNNIHKDLHKITRSLTCNICGGKFNGRKHFDLHYKTHSIAKGFKCDDCEKTFSSENVLKFHKRSHGNLKPFKCTYCKMEFKYASKLRRHLRRHKSSQSTTTSDSSHEPISTPEELDESVSITQREIKTEKTVTDEYICDVCSCSFPTAQDLTAHYSVHLYTNVKYLCQICDLHFDDESVFTEHIKLHGEVVFEVRPEAEEIQVEQVQDMAQIVRVLNSLSGFS